MNDYNEAFISKLYTTRDIRFAHKRILDVWPRLKADFGMDTKLTLEISCTYRSPQAQNDIYQIGRTKPGSIVTNIDGLTKFSKHNYFPSLAIDVFVTMAGKVAAIWDPKVFDPLGELAEKYGLIWGGNWKDFVDKPHIELPDSYLTEKR
ncbi:MAG: hypothetical protein A3F67_05125 [Verrucomicrobia bacterium RIFCSPHIGHO2_12_FULL_41_10]|nr:MAG: hypothetical protein A3F67_05125 [Verrucomicrobia bacterium RIFCSPHIGHO2_12_FULL_41_10]